ncbi:MAG: hypothetical protein M5U34_04100 [Chloroflexi bacterium]|nr:hypothetical protein [Chloroflexota bacterium]
MEQATTPYGTVLVDCDAYTSTSIELTNPGYPVVSPDSSKIAIAGRNAITVYDLISGESKVLLEFEHIATYTQAPFLSGTILGDRFYTSYCRDPPIRLVDGGCG